MTIQERVMAHRGKLGLCVLVHGLAGRETPFEYYPATVGQREDFIARYRAAGYEVELPEAPL